MIDKLPKIPNIGDRIEHRASMNEEAEDSPIESGDEEETKYSSLFNISRNERKTSCLQFIRRDKYKNKKQTKENSGNCSKQ